MLSYINKVSEQNKIYFNNKNKEIKERKKAIENKYSKISSQGATGVIVNQDGTNSEMVSSSSSPNGQISHDSPIKASDHYLYSSSM